MVPRSQDASRDVGRAEQGGHTLPGALWSVARIFRAHGQVDFSPIIVGCTTRRLPLRRVGRARPLLPDPPRRALPRFRFGPQDERQALLRQLTARTLFEVGDDPAGEFADAVKPRVHVMSLGCAGGSVMPNRLGDFGP